MAHDESKESYKENKTFTGLFCIEWIFAYKNKVTEEEISKVINHVTGTSKIDNKFNLFINEIIIPEPSDIINTTVFFFV